MRIRYTLNEDEIREIIATHFKVTKDNIVLHITETIIGYGMDAHKVQNTECFVNLDEPKDFDYKP